MRVAINKKSYYGSEGSSDIEMPPLDQVSPAQEIPNPWDQQQKQATDQGGVFSVPDDLPQETRQAMQQYEPQEEAEEQLEETAEEVVQVKPQTKESSVAANMRALREGREKAERERDELMRILQMQMQQQQPKASQQVSEPEIELPSIDDESLVEGKYINKINQKYDRKLRSLEEQLQQYKVQSAEAILEAKIKAQFPDFENVVSKENVEILRARKPFLAKLLSESTDTYSKAVEAYQAIKDLGIHRTHVMDQDHARAIKNAAKPRPLTSVNPQQGDSPLSKANAFANGEFTAEMKAQLLREMNQIRKQN